MKVLSFKFFWSKIIASILLISGCGIPSVHPIYTPDDLVTIGNLEGVWQHQRASPKYSVIQLSTLNQRLGDGSLDEFEEAGLGNAYIIQNLSNPETILIAGIIEINNNYYIDFYQLNFGLRANSLTFNTHAITKASIREDQVILHNFSELWIKEKIKNRAVRIRHEVNVFDDIILTAGTRELQQFITMYGDIEEAYTNYRSYRRISTEHEFIFDIDQE